MNYTNAQLAMAVNGVLMERWAAVHKQFEGKRNVYQSAGYPNTITLADYEFRYARQDLAQRIVRIFADETWKGETEVQDTESADDSAFETAFRMLAETELTEDGDTKPGITHYLNRLDVVAGKGHYAVLLLGLADGRALSEPADKGKLSDPSDLMYVSVFGEEDAGIGAYNDDPSNRRFGKPEYYNLKIAHGDNEDIARVHWTRVIHVADGAMTNDLLGTPRLEAVYNRLLDIEKVLAATGEGGWQVMNPATIFKTMEGYELPRPDPSMPQEMRTALEDARTEQAEQIDELVHGLRRALTLEGLEPVWQPTEMSDPSGAVDAFLKMVSAGTGIPLRILTGSERGELASSQDEAAWANVIEARRTHFAEPLILRPVVNRLRWLGALPEPASGKYTVNWTPLKADDPNEQADRADKVAGALQKLGAKVDPKAFVATYLPELPEDAVEEREEPQPGMDALGNPIDEQIDPSTGDSGQPGDNGDNGDKEVQANAAFFRYWQAYP